MIKKKFLLESSPLKTLGNRIKINIKNKFSIVEKSKLFQRYFQVSKI